MENSGNTASMHYNILIVDDEEQVLKALQRCLRNEPYTIYTVRSGQEALQFLETTAVDLLLTDFRMPDMNGSELVEKVQEKHPEIIRIILSGYSEAWAVIDAVNRGSIYKFLTKPWDDEELKISLKRALEAKVLSRENIELAKKLQQANKRLIEINTDQEKIIATRTMEAMEAHNAVEKTLNGVVLTMSLLMDAHNADLSGHGKRTANYSRLLADALNADVERKDLERAAFLHDIGKIYLHDCILNNPDEKLSNSEIHILRSHTNDGYVLLKQISGFENVASMVLHHHESFDGRGYPDGLRGEEIPAASRIITVADAFDRMVYPRTMTAVVNVNNIRERMLSLCHGYLDPNMCEVFLNKVYPHLSFDEVFYVPLYRLRPEMKLAETLCDNNGNLIYPKDDVLNEEKIDRIVALNRLGPYRTKICIKVSSSPPGNFSDHLSCISGNENQSSGGEAACHETI